MSDIFYNGKRIPKDLFRTYVYGLDENGNVIKKIANSFDEFKQLLLSRQWFEHKAEAEKNKEKQQKKEHKNFKKPKDKD